MTELRDNRADSLNEFLQVWNETIVKLNEYLEDNPVSEAVQGSADYLTCLDGFLELCRNYDISAVDYFYDNRRLFKSNMKKDDFQLANELVSKYDFKTGAYSRCLRLHFKAH